MMNLMAEGCPLQYQDSKEMPMISVYFMHTYIRDSQTEFNLVTTLFHIYLYSVLLANIRTVLLSRMYSSYSLWPLPFLDLLG